uniref:Uncharacterized protein n=1 Tax=Knipowitschia caucasica TaxID=637954 RepID=A0AAV2JQX1_KNICA
MVGDRETCGTPTVCLHTPDACRSLAARTRLSQLSRNSGLIHSGCCVSWSILVPQSSSLMLNDRQALIKATPKASCHRPEGQSRQQCARAGRKPRIRDQTLWLDFISFITDNTLSTVDLHHCQIICSLCRIVALSHTTEESRSLEVAKVHSSLI